jgi:hypothetical protein
MADVWNFEVGKIGMQTHIWIKRSTFKNKRKKEIIAVISILQNSHLRIAREQEVSSESFPYIYVDVFCA